MFIQSSSTRRAPVGKPNVEGQEPFRYPEDAFAQGLIDGRVVDCLSVSLQLRFHRGYVQRERDNHDVALLKPSLDVAAPRRRLPEAAQRSADSRSSYGARNGPYQVGRRCGRFRT
jgi:hypothetical protein